MDVLDGAFKRVIHITVVYPSASCSWSMVSDQGDERGSSSVSTAGRIKIFLNLRISTLLFPLPLLHVLLNHFSCAWASSISAAQEHVSWLSK